MFSNAHWSRTSRNYVPSFTSAGEVPQQKLSVNEKYEKFFGKENRPHPFYYKIGRDTSSVKKYMKGLYDSVQKSRDVEFANETIVEKADTVVGFVNHGGKETVVFMVVCLCLSNWEYFFF